MVHQCCIRPPNKFLIPCLVTFVDADSTDFDGNPSLVDHHSVLFVRVLELNW